VVKVLMFNLKKNYFELFELPQTYQIDEKLLKQRYLLIMQQVHPDRFVKASAQEQRLAVQFTGLINEALETLQSPVKRAAYLLKLNNMPVDFESNTIMAKDFLFEQITWREKIADAKQDANKLAMVKKEIEIKYQALINELNLLFAEKNFLQAQQLTLQLKFFEQLLKSSSVVN